MRTKSLSLFHSIVFFLFVFPLCCLGQNEKGKKIYIKNFGAIANGKSNCTDAFQKAAAYLNENGGTLVINPGVYIVGRQRQTKNYRSYAFIDDSILCFRNAKYPITILGYGATLKAAAGLKYGSFNPVTGKKDSVRKEGTRFSYYASAFTVINAIGCSSITVKGLTIDGNSSKLDIGPAFGPEGIQLSATGIRLHSNQNALVEDCYIHHCALDALLIGWPGLKGTDPEYPHVIRNVKARFNGRQGLSWVGGNNLSVYNCEFSSTGKAINKNSGKLIASKPTFGIDVEVEESIIKNGYFHNCLVFNNGGSGLASIGYETENINFTKCTFIGTTNSAAYLKRQCFKFDSCTFVGKVERLFGSEDASKAVSFKNCLFTMDKKKSPNGKVFGEYCEFFGAKNVVFENCVFDGANKRLPLFNQQELTFINCSFKQNSKQDFRASAIFKGNTKFEMKGGGKILGAEAITSGQIFYNNKIIPNLKSIKE